MRKRVSREKLYIGLLCLIASGVLLLLCSQCSPLYPINVWGDANCLLTVGRVMREGGVVYRDIYEQKGPTLYLIHALAACISDTSFFGVYVLEVISFAAVLYMACRPAMRRVSAGAAFAGAVLVGACVLVGSAFSRGDSAEEFCLPYLMGALCLAMSHYGEKDGPMAPRALFICDQVHDPGPVRGPLRGGGRAGPARGRHEARAYECGRVPCRHAAAGCGVVCVFCGAWRAE